MEHIELEPISTISERLKTILKIRNIKPTELAAATGISKASISQYLSGKVKPKQDRIYIIAIATNVRPSWLMGYNVPRTQYNITLNEDPVSEKYMTEKDEEVLQHIGKYIKNVDENTQNEMIHRVKELYDLYQYKKKKFNVDSKRNNKNCECD